MGVIELLAWIGLCFFVRWWTRTMRQASPTSVGSAQPLKKQPKRTQVMHPAAVGFTGESQASRQRQLDNYVFERKGTSQDAGKVYEQYIAWTISSEGWHIYAQGVLQGLKDEGVDLIAYKGESVLLIQAKRFKAKRFHEMFGRCVTIDVIEKLGSVLEKERLKHPDKKYFARIVTSNVLNADAKELAVKLQIDFWEKYALKKFPLVKCTIDHDGRKTYCTPFDAEYDGTAVIPEKGGICAWTLEEAESNGFVYAENETPETRAMTRSMPLDAGDTRLFERLREVRRTIADEWNRQPFMVCSDRTLRHLAQERPVTRSKMLTIHGIGPAKWEAFGERFVEAIRAHAQETAPPDTGRSANAT